jgi:hypothetical protein
VCLEASTKPHVHRKFEIFWTNIASTMTCPNIKNKPKNGLRPLGVRGTKLSYKYGSIKSKSQLDNVLKNQPAIRYRWFTKHLITYNALCKLGSVQCSIFMEIGNFTFLQILLILNLEYTWTFISTVGIFFSWKIEITKNSVRFASVMEIFCTLL